MIVAVQHYPNEAIYLWTDDLPPIACSLPWDEEVAKKLEIGLRKARDRGEAGVLFGLEYGQFELHPPPVRDPPHKE